MTDYLKPTGELPALERLEFENQDALLRRTVADTLRESPALRTLSDVVRADDELFGEVADFMSRREDFKAGYDRPGRTVAPWFAAVARKNPDLLDTALDEHFRVTSADVQERLLNDATEQGYSYWPMLVIGTGPQAQIFASSALRTQAKLADSILLIDKAPAVGGTFRPTEGMNFRLNSRTRPQTDEQPVPGTKANLNTLAPGVVTLPDSVTETYPTADTFGRTLRLNHALNGLPVGLGLELTAVIPDENEPREGDLPGRVTAVVRDEGGNEYSIRTSALIATTGVGEPKLDRFSQETRNLIWAEQDKMDTGERPAIMTYDNFYEWMSSQKFPLKDIKNVAVIGAGDSGRTAVGTLLGYEPRPDGSVLQIDSLDNITWYGQNSGSDERFVENNRLRYAQLGLEMPRRQNQSRNSRITSYGDRPSNIQVNEETGKASINSEDFDLVVLATGFKNDGEGWLRDKLKQPMFVADARVQDALSPDSSQPLSTGDIVLFPEGYNLNKLQVLARREDILGSPVYTVSIEAADGSKYIGELDAISTDGERKSLNDYLNLSNFVDPEALVASKPAEALSMTAFLDLSTEEQLAFLQKEPVLFPGDRGYDLFGLNSRDTGAGDYGYRVIQADRSQIVLNKLIYVPATGSFVSGTREIVKLDELTAFYEDLGETERRSVFMVNEFLAPNLAPGSTKEVMMNGNAVLNKVEDLARSNAVLLFDANSSTVRVAAFYKDQDGQIQCAVVHGPGQFDNRTWESLSFFENSALQLSIRDVTRISVLTPAQTEALSAQKKPTAILSSDFANLTRTEQMEYLQPGAIVYPGSENSPPLLVQGRGDDDTVRLLTLLRGDDGLRPAPAGPGTELSLTADDLTRRMRVTGSRIGAANGGIVYNPVLLQDGRLNSQTVPFNRENIAESVAELARQGAVLVDSTLRSRLDQFSFFTDEAGDIQALAYRDRAGGYYVTPYDLETAVDYLSNRSPNLDTAYIPVRQLGSMNLPVSLRQPRTAEFAAVSQDGEAIAKRLEDTQIYLAGPAAGLKVSSDVTRLIPDIPENSVGVFISQPRVVKLAGRTATTLRGISRPQKRERKAPTLTTDFNDSEYSTLFLDELHSASRPVSTTAKRMPAEMLVRYGLGTTARHHGVKSDGNANGQGTLRLQLDQGYFDTSIEVDDSVQDDALFPVSYETIEQLLDSPIVIHGLRKLLSGKGFNTARLELPFDHRGLDVNNIVIDAKKSQARRSGLPTIPARPTS